LGVDYKEFEHRLAAAIHRRFGLPEELPASVEKAIKRADRASAWLEATQLAGFEKVEADKFFGRPRFMGWADLRLAPEPPNTARAAFLKRFEMLLAACA